MQGPILCAITNGRCRPGAASDALPLIRRVVAAGVTIVQIREPALGAGDLLTLTQAAMAIARGSRTRVVVNERLDVALAAGADGVHLRSISMSGIDARTLAPPGFLLGRSVHDADEGARHAADGGLDYLLFGTVFSTASKPAGWRVAGTDLLRQLVERVDLPVLAVGGVNVERAPDVARTGAAGLAGIGLFSPPDAADVTEVVSRVLQAFIPAGDVERVQ